MGKNSFVSPTVKGIQSYKITEKHKNTPFPVPYYWLKGKGVFISFIIDLLPIFKL